MGKRIEHLNSETLSFESEGQLLQGSFYWDDSSQPIKAVILCHGAFEGRENWAEYAQRLAAQGFPSLVFDFVGHGESAGRRGLVDMRQWAYNIRDAMNALGKRGFRHFALVGWGSGGSAALLAAAHDRRLVCVVVLAAPVQLIPPLNERAAYILATGASRVLKAVRKKPLTFSREQALESHAFRGGELRRMPAYKADLRQRETWKAVPIPESLDSVWIDITKAAAKIKIPVLILHGGGDQSGAGEAERNTATNCCRG